MCVFWSPDPVLWICLSLTIFLASATTAYPNNRSPLPLGELAPLNGVTAPIDDKANIPFADGASSPTSSELEHNWLVFKDQYRKTHPQKSSPRRQSSETPLTQNVPPTPSSNVPTSADDKADMPFVDSASRPTRSDIEHNWLVFKDNYRKTHLQKSSPRAQSSGLPHTGQLPTVKSAATLKQELKQFIDSYKVKHPAAVASHFESSPTVKVNTPLFDAASGSSWASYKTDRFPAAAETPSNGLKADFGPYTSKDPVSENLHDTGATSSVVATGSDSTQVKVSTSGLARSEGPISGNEGVYSFATKYVLVETPTASSANIDVSLKSDVSSTGSTLDGKSASELVTEESSPTAHESPIIDPTIVLIIGVSAAGLILVLFVVILIYLLRGRWNSKKGHYLNYDLNRWDPQLLRPSQKSIDSFVFGTPLPSISEMIKKQEFAA